MRRTFCHKLLLAIRDMKDLEMKNAFYNLDSLVGEFKFLYDGQHYEIKITPIGGEIYHENSDGKERNVCGGIVK